MTEVREQWIVIRKDCITTWKSGSISLIYAKCILSRWIKASLQRPISTMLHAAPHAERHHHFSSKWSPTCSICSVRRVPELSWFPGRMRRCKFSGAHAFVEWGGVCRCWCHGAYARRDSCPHWRLPKYLCLCNAKLRDSRDVVNWVLYVELRSNVSENITKTKIHILRRQFKRESIKSRVCYKNANTPKTWCFTKVYMLTEC